jgi:hypothetical protein
MFNVFFQLDMNQTSRIHKKRREWRDEKRIGTCADALRVPLNFFTRRCRQRFPFIPPSSRGKLSKSCHFKEGKRRAGAGMMAGRSG